MDGNDNQSLTDDVRMLYNALVSFKSKSGECFLFRNCDFDSTNYYQPNGDFQK